MNRRGFIKKAGIGIAGFPLLSLKKRFVPPSDTLRVAHIGLGGMGRTHLQWFAEFPDVETVALCDVDQTRLAEGQTLLQSLRSGAKAEVYSDFRHILDRSDVDVVTCATPDHWHALVSIMAFQAGKDVYGEKPLAHSVAEGQAMLRHQLRHNTAFQLGTQIHAGDNYHRVVEIVQSGLLGTIHTVRIWKTGYDPDLGFPLNETPPETLDWDMWLGPAPYVPYTPARCHGTFRHFYDYSGGTFADFWCHIADIAFWALDPQELTSVDATGEKLDGIAETPLWIDVHYAYKDLDMYWTTTPLDIPWANGRHIGANFEGTDGSLICDYEEREIYLNGEVLTDLPGVPVSLPRSPGHQRNFLDAVKSRREPESNLSYVRKMTLPMHLGSISFRLKRKLFWDSQNEAFIDDFAANYLLSRPYRAPWSLPA